MNTDADRAYFKRRRETRFAQGICKDCDNPTRPGRTTCVACYTKVSVRHANKRALEVANRQLKVCAHCGTTIGVDYKPRGGRPSTFCSEKCRNSSKNIGPRTVACALCSKPFTTLKNGKYCSKECVLKATRVTRPKDPFLSQCRHCQSEMVVQRTKGGWKRVCAPCKAASERRERRNRRLKHGKGATDRARKRGLPFERVGPIAVCTRDKWHCQLCGVSTPRRLRGTFHPHAPEVDHIVPLAAPNSPGHVWANVQCLCRSCNGKKGATTLGQLRLDIAC